MKQGDFCHLLEAAWAAGFFDGEGCIYLHGNGKGRTYARINISQLDPEVLYRFRDACGGAGKVAGPIEYEDRNSMYFYQAGHSDDVKAVIDTIYPYLSSIKRKQIDEKMLQADTPRKYTRRLSAEQIESLLDDYRNGMTYRQIAAKYDREYNAIVKLISKKRDLI